MGLNSWSLYGSFTIEDAENIGKKFMGKCLTNNGYEHDLTIGNVYEIEVTPRILPMSPLCKTIGDRGKTVECHLDRFDKVGKS
jgi:hypothetical protein